MAAYTTIDDPELYFQTKLYTGNDSTNAQTLDGDENMQVDLVWVKRRTGASGSMLFDNARAAGFIQSDATNAEQDGANYFVSLDSDGFTFEGSDNSNNENNETYVAWCWKESATAGFDIVSYTGNATSDTSISHSLSAVPKTIFIKNRSTAGAWMVYHEGLGYNSGTIPRFLQLDNTNAQNNGGSGDFPAPPTSSVFKVGSYDTMNKSGDGIIAYCFAEKQGFSKFGTYTGNGSATSGPFIYTGFRPAMVITKEKSGTGHWRIRDNKRSTYNTVGIVSHANATTADTTEDNTDFLSNGFKLYTSGGENNGSGDTYCYWAWAEQPFVNSEGVPCNAR